MKKDTYAENGGSFELLRRIEDGHDKRVKGLLSLREGPVEAETQMVTVCVTLRFRPKHCPRIKGKEKRGRDFTEWVQKKDGEGKQRPRG